MDPEGLGPSHLALLPNITTHYVSLFAPSSWCNNLAFRFAFDLNLIWLSERRTSRIRLWVTTVNASSASHQGSVNLSIYSLLTQFLILNLQAQLSWFPGPPALPNTGGRERLPVVFLPDWLSVFSLSVCKPCACISVCFHLSCVTGLFSLWTQAIGSVQRLVRANWICSNERSCL